MGVCLIVVVGEPSLVDLMQPGAAGGGGGRVWVRWGRTGIPHSALSASGAAQLGLQALARYWQVGHPILPPPPQHHGMITWLPRQARPDAG